MTWIIRLVASTTYIESSFSSSLYGSVVLKMICKGEKLVDENDQCIDFKQ